MLFEEVFVPDNLAFPEAASRVTHMGIGAHQDDLEIFAYHGIEACYESSDLWFAGVTVTSGGGSSRAGPYRDFTDEEMIALRHKEQNEAAVIGKYAYQSQLGFMSSDLKNESSSAEVVKRLARLLEISRPDILYLHNPADKHETHISTLKCCLAALRSIPKSSRPKQVYGCEVWRDLDWVDDESKVALAVDRYPKLATSLIDVFASQIKGGKDYTKATLGRRCANATYFKPRQIDAASAYTFALDLNPLIDDSTLSIADFIGVFIKSFEASVLSKLQS